jgi:RNA polymerase sigma factor (sigma-70 family)
MPCSSGSVTRVTLLRRLSLAPSDSAAWAEFVACYSRKIYNWARTWGLQDADAQDVTQSVFVNLTTQLGRFHYDPNRSFRAWLRAVTRQAWLNYLRKRSKAIQGSGSTLVSPLTTVEARVDLFQRLKDTFDDELLHEAAIRVRLRVEPRTWNAFYLLAVEGLSGAEVAKRLQMKVATVYVARGKVQHMLTKVIKQLEQSLGHDEHESVEDCEL